MDLYAVIAGTWLAKRLARSLVRNKGLISGRELRRLGMNVERLLKQGLLKELKEESGVRSQESGGGDGAETAGNQQLPDGQGGGAKNDGPDGPDGPDQPGTDDGEDEGDEEPGGAENDGPDQQGTDDGEDEGDEEPGEAETDEPEGDGAGDEAVTTASGKNKKKGGKRK
jgi:hypothetical protein